jgi:hypothetical protein
MSHGHELAIGGPVLEQAEQRSLGSVMEVSFGLLDYQREWRSLRQTDHQGH